MIAMMRKIATAEAAEITDDAFAFITRAAEGTTRYAKTWLEPAISHCGGATTAY